MLHDGIVQERLVRVFSFLYKPFTWIKYSLMPKGNLFPFKMMESFQAEKKLVSKVTVISSMVLVNEIFPPPKQKIKLYVFLSSHLSWEINYNHFVMLSESTNKFEKCDAKILIKVYAWLLLNSFWISFVLRSRRN